ncbi:MAG: CoA pyrophosphatase [Nitrosarchaeum sp.]|nr:CoA pyrophosphatase [Nitrosarchaeum sp.]
MLEKIKSTLTSTLSLYPSNDEKNRIASVLIVIYGSEPKILMTKKSQILKLHAGEIAFPGGKYESEDADLLETALRETREEVNLSIRNEHIIGQLQPVTTLNSRFTIHPFVAVVKRLPRLKDNPEVETILNIPLFPLLRTMSPDMDPTHQSIKEMYTFTYNNHLIWGASARMLKQINDVFLHSGLLEQKPSNAL